MATLRIKLEKKKEIVKFQFLYSLHQHLGWPRSNRDIPEEISIFTTKELVEANIEILNEISKWINLKII